MEMSKSEAIWDIVRLIRLKVITYNDLSDFSGELQNEVKEYLREQVIHMEIATKSSSRSTKKSTKIEESKGAYRSAGTHLTKR